MGHGRLRGWRSEQHVSGSGSVASVQRALAASPVVPATEAGAAQLGQAYWIAVEAFTRGVVRARATESGLELRLLGRWPTLLSFGPAALAVTGGSTRCTYPIRGGGLARRPGGEIAFAQTVAADIELSSVIRDFFPTLAARPGAPRWAGLLYSHGQRRLHLAISRRYFRRLIAEAPA